MTEVVDFTPQEARDEILKFTREVGPKAILEVNLEVRGALYRGYFKPEGHAGRAYAFIHADTYREVMVGARAEWEKLSGAHNADMIRRMALKIIEITADLGECTDAALRVTFDEADISRFSERAIERANEMAANGPFSVVPTPGANNVLGGK